MTKYQKKAAPDDDAPVLTAGPDVLTSRKASLEQPYREGELELVERVAKRLGMVKP